MDFPTCGSTATDSLMLLFTQYETIRGLPLSSVSLSHCITCQDVYVTCSAPIQWFQVNPDCTPKKTYSHNNAILDKQKANLGHCVGKCTGLRTHLFIVESALHSAFPNTEVALRIYLCLIVANCTKGGSFSKLRRIQNYLWSSIVQKN